MGKVSAPVSRNTPARCAKPRAGRGQVQSPNPPQTDELPLVFERPLVIVGGGRMEAALLHRLHAQGAAVIAADSGAHGCAAAGLLPEAIIGDLDSLDDPAAWAARTRVLAFADQETTDFEKCLAATRAPVTIAMGMTGARFDHTLAALDAVARHARDRWIVLVDEVDIALAVSGSFSFAVEPGERVSVHPLGGVTFARSTGLRYPLDGLTLAPGVRTGTSNEAVTGAVTISPGPGEDGVWLLILDGKNLVRVVADLMARFPAR